MSRGKEKQLPSPPLKASSPEKDGISNTSEIASTGESDRSRSSTNASETIDYSNPNRKIVYETSKIEESTILESVTELSETNSHTSLTQESVKEVSMDRKKSEKIKEISQTVEKKNENDHQIEIVNFSDEDIDSIPAQWPKIQQDSDKNVTKKQNKPESGGRSSDVSFNLSDLSDITETSADKQVASLNKNFSDNEDNDEEIINAPVHVLEKSNVLKNIPAEDEDSIDISELLDHFSVQIKDTKSTDSIFFD